MTRLTEKQLSELPHEILYDTGAVDMRRIGQTADYVPTEREEQTAVIAWADAHPVAYVLYANVNGQYRQGQRPEPGLRPGVPDLFLPVARDGYHGLYIELKRTVAAVTSADQRRWIETLRNNGYQAVVCMGADEAIAQIEAYLEGDASTPLQRLQEMEYAVSAGNLAREDVPADTLTGWFRYVLEGGDK